ncbi:MAG: Rne/Rng family ribonuclease [Xanthomonadales bacterium]|nr:Rne/Rng family ribonuclease [Xanthomonadales bacterium]
MKRMLINATQPEELRVAVADGQLLIDLDIEVPSQEQKKSNVYKGKITRIEPSLEACFVDFGSTRHGFLPFKEICPEAYANPPRKKEGRPSIKEVMKEGQEVIVQVEKEERGNKGAALTTYLSLAGRYLVLMPTNPKAGGVSRRISGEDRAELREQLQQVIAPDNVGIIVRTAGVGREADELQWDLDYLLQLWGAIEKAAAEKSAPFLIYQESNLFIRALRDHLRNDIGEILIDNPAVFKNAQEFMQQVMPHNMRKLKIYDDPVPLFNRFQIESQIESAFARTVHLPAGGALVIDHTEAMLAIDINSARATKGADIEETAFKTNLEAADEIARQLRLRDLGGLIVIDFIDMNDRKHQRAVEERLRHALQIDKARVQTGRISRFGLLEMSRQRLRPSLGESSQEPCPRCDGHGTIRSVESLALSILRLVEEECMKDYTGQVIIQTPVTVANFLLNEKRTAVAEIEHRHNAPILVVANEYMERPKFEIHRIRKTDVSDDPSYARSEKPAAELVANAESQASSALGAPAPAVTPLSHSSPAPSRQTRAVEENVVKSAKPGFFGQLFARLLNGADKKDEAESVQPKKKVTRKKTASKAPARGSKKTTTRQASDGRPRKRGPRKKTTRSNAGQQGQSEGRRATKKTPRKKAPRKKTATNRAQPDKQQQQNKQQAPAARKETPATDGGNGQRKPRRRRSPYQTAGGKGREGRKDDQVKAATGESKPASTTKSAPQQVSSAASEPTAKPPKKPAGAEGAGARRSEPGKQAESKPATSASRAPKPQQQESGAGHKTALATVPGKDVTLTEATSPSAGPGEQKKNSRPKTNKNVESQTDSDKAKSREGSVAKGDSRRDSQDGKKTVKEGKKATAETKPGSKKPGSRPRQVSKKEATSAKETGPAVKKDKGAKDKSGTDQRKPEKTAAPKKAASESPAKPAKAATPPTPKAKPSMTVVRDDKGIYTLQPATPKSGKKGQDGGADSGD